MTLILASHSPRRRELLAQLGVAFDAVAANVDEAQRLGEAPIALARRLARSKALAVAARFSDRPVLAADTIVVLDGQVLGKPAGEGEATAMLRDLRGRPHQVFSAVFALDPRSGAQAAELSETLVWMRDYSDAEIAAYVASRDPLDKAGAYAIQHRGFSPVARLEGCYSGVMGFPLGHVARALRAVGVAVPVEPATACRPYAGSCCQATRAGGRPGLTRPGRRPTSPTPDFLSFS